MVDSQGQLTVKWTIPRTKLSPINGAGGASVMIDLTAKITGQQLWERNEESVKETALQTPR